MKRLANIGCLATCCLDAGPGEVDEIHDATLVWEDETIRWVGPEADLPAAFADAERHDAAGALVVPGLIDCHTHLAFGGWRADEFEQKLRGASYLDIARAGGGIRSTVRHTRAAAEDALYDRAAGTLQAMADLGVTTVEAKSGYGLDVETELKQLRVYQRLAADQPLGIVPTYLAHLVPDDFVDDRPAYLRRVIDEVLPRIAEEDLARFCDVFVEETAFTVEEARTLFEAARRHGLRAKLHADQITDSGGAVLAAEVRAASADHLEMISEEGIDRMARVGVVAVLLPLATLYLNQEPPPVRKLLKAGVPVAIATDFNPGSAPSFHLPFALTLACTRFRMTPADVLRGATIQAARALKMEKTIGSLEPGKQADFALIDAPSVAHWFYHLQANACLATIVRGRLYPTHRFPA